MSFKRGDTIAVRGLPKRSSLYPVAKFCGGEMIDNTNYICKNESTIRRNRASFFAQPEDLISCKRLLTERT